MSEAESNQPPQVFHFEMEDGTPVQVDRENYREKILPGIFEKHWDDPDALYGAALEAYNDEFYTEGLPAARRLMEIDPIPERCHVLLGLYLINLKKLEEARELYEGYLEEHGESAYVYANLARVYSMEERPKDRDQALDRALSLNPNVRQTLVWALDLARMKDTDQEAREAVLESLHRYAKHPDAWLPQLRIAELMIREEDIAGAREWIDQALAHPLVSSDYLVDFMTKLGEAGHAALVLEIFRSYYKPGVHHPFFGLNLLQACLVTRDRLAGFQIMGQMEAVHSGDQGLEERLVFYRDKFAAMDGEPDPA